jgi:hypothetical protein
MKTRTLIGAMVLGVGMLLGGSKTSEAGWCGPRVYAGFAAPRFYRSFYRPFAFRPYFYAPRFAPRVFVRPYFRPHVSYFRAW